MNFIAGPLDTMAAPTLQERRLTGRLQLYWEQKRAGRPYPALADIDGGEIDSLWPWCFVLDGDAHQRIPYFHYLGPKLARYSGVFLSGKSDWTLTLLDKAVLNYRKVLESGQPVVLQDQVTLFDGRRLLFRSVMLPLGDAANERVGHVLGAANGKMADAGAPA